MANTQAIQLNPFAPPAGFPDMRSFVARATSDESMAATGRSVLDAGKGVASGIVEDWQQNPWTNAAQLGLDVATGGLGRVARGGVGVVSSLAGDYARGQELNPFAAALAGVSAAIPGGRAAKKGIIDAATDQKLGKNVPIKEWENAGWVTPQGKLLQYTDEHALAAELADTTERELLDAGYLKLHPYSGQLTVGGAKSATPAQKNVLRSIGTRNPETPVTWEFGDIYGEGMDSLLGTK